MVPNLILCEIARAFRCVPIHIVFVEIALLRGFRYPLDVVAFVKEVNSCVTGMHRIIGKGSFLGGEHWVQSWYQWENPQHQTNECASFTAALFVVASHCAPTEGAQLQPGLTAQATGKRSNVA